MPKKTKKKKKPAMSPQEKVLKLVAVLVKENKPVTAERVATRARMKRAATRRALVALVVEGRLTRRFDYVTEFCHGRRQPVGRYFYSLATEVAP